MHAAFLATTCWCYEPYKPYDTVDSRILKVFYGVVPYRSPYRSPQVSNPNGTVTVAVIRMPVSRQYGNGVQPYQQARGLDGDLPFLFLMLPLRAPLRNLLVYHSTAENL
jgi:hypothetical protein